MRIKIIKTEKEYEEALANVSRLMDKGDNLSDKESEQLEVIVQLIQDYENSQFPIALPDPIEAIKFRMEQQGLTQKDLIPYLGSKSKVSEVLSGKRPLSISMIKALREGLDIPSDILLNQNRTVGIEGVSQSAYPIKEMIKRGYIEDDGGAIMEKVNQFLSVLNGFSNMKTLMSKTTYVRSDQPMNGASLNVWVAEVVRKASKYQPIEFNIDKLSEDFLIGIVKLSSEESAIEKAIKRIESIGIQVIIEPRMPKTYLDGAVIMFPDKNPIIGLTIRHDRLDNFWFTLLHELAHIKLHYGKGLNIFFDEVQYYDDSKFEMEADSYARNIIVPEKLWIDSVANILPSKDTIRICAEELGIHPALVAGKIRFEKRKYHLFNELVGSGEVKRNLPQKL